MFSKLARISSPKEKVRKKAQDGKPPRHLSMPQASVSAISLSELPERSPGLLELAEEMTRLGIGYGIPELVDPLSPVELPAPDRQSPTATRAGNESPIFGTPVILERPRLCKKSITAPPGSFSAERPIPQPPRRAISARKSRAIRIEDKAGSMSRDVSPGSPRLLSTATPQTRWMISRKKSRHSVGKVGLKPRGSAWRKRISNTKKAEAVFKILDEGEGSWESQQVSFSERPRIRQTLKNTKLQTLKTTDIVDFNARRLPKTPMSMVATPREMYADWTPPRTPDTSQRRALQVNSHNRGRSHSTPSTVTMWNVADCAHPDYRRRASEKNTRVGSLTEPPAHLNELRRGGARNARLMLRNGSIVEVLTPETSPWTRPVYVPGPIRIEKQLFAPGLDRKGSVVSIEPWVAIMHDINGEPRRPSDEAALDDIVEYFEKLGVVEYSGDDALDCFWEDGKRPTAVPLMELEHISPAPVTPPPQSGAIPSTKSKQSRVGTSPRPSPRRFHTPQRMKLRRLLSPASSFV